MHSKLDICNRSLRLIGENIVTSLNEKTKSAEECRFLYPLIKREVIESYPWKCTRKNITLQCIYDTNYQNEEYPYKFLLPYDCIRVLSVDNSNSFKRDGIYLYYQNSPVDIYYTADIEERYMTLRLSKIISLKLALELVFSLLGDTGLINRINNMLSIENKKLTQLDSEEGDIIKKELHLNHAENWLNARL